MSGSRIFRYSRIDVVTVAVVPLHLAGLIGLAMVFEHLAWWALLLIAPGLFIASLQSAGANHNHFHTPVFRARRLNQLLRIGFSSITTPATPHNIGHSIHHATPQSWNETSVIELAGLKRPLAKQLMALVTFIPESLGVKYVTFLVLLKVWRVERVAALAAPNAAERDFFAKLLERTAQPANFCGSLIDVTAWIAVRVVLGVIDWRFFFLYFLPVQFMIETVRRTENYLQHWGATDPMDSTRDSVSCYAGVYNLVTFNLGYHQEHHLRPAVHWSQLPGLREELPPDRRTVPLTHYINLPLFYPSVAKRLSVGAFAGRVR